MVPKRPHDIFISFRMKHNSKQSNPVGTLYRELVSKGYNPFMFEEKKYEAAEFRKAAAKVIKSEACKAFILCCGLDMGRGSSWVADEDGFEGQHEPFDFNETQWEIFHAIERVGGWDTFLRQLAGDEPQDLPFITMTIGDEFKFLDIEGIPPRLLRLPMITDAFVDIDRGVGKVIERLKDLGVEPQAPIKDIDDKPEALDGALTDWERAYIENALSNWIDGRGVASGAPPRSALGFRAERFINLNVREIGNAESDLIAADGKPALSYLLNSKPQPPMVLYAPSGRGKTCVLSMAAATIATALDDAFAKQCTGLPDDLSGLLGAVDGAPPVPVFLRAERISEGLHDGLEPIAAFFDAIAKRISRSKEVSPQVVRERMLARDYTVIVDELDRLSDDEEMNVLHALVHVHKLLKSRDRNTKIIAAMRLRGRERVAPMLELELLTPTEPQREDFYTAFAQSSADPAGARQDILAAVGGLRMHLSGATGSPNSDILDNPLLLNAFCWAAIHKNAEVQHCGTVGELCETLVDSLIGNGIKTKAVELSADETRDALHALGFASMSEDLDVAKAQQCVSQALGRAGGKELQVLEKQTGLFERIEHSSKRTLLRLKRPFAELFAAQRIVAQNENDLFLPEDGGVATRSWRTALGFAVAMMMRDPEQVARGERLLSGLMARAQVAQSADEQADWFACVTSCLIELAPLPEDGVAPHQVIIDAAGAFLRDARNWSPRQRAAALSDLSLAMRRSSAAAHRKSVTALLTRVLDLKTHWIDAANAISGFEHPSGDGDALFVAGMPVLSAHFQEFYSVASGEVGPAAADLRAHLHANPGAPAVLMTFDEAVAYCQWLTGKLHAQLDGYEIRLPTVSEYEALIKAIRGKHARVWGSQDVGKGDAARVNWRGAEIGSPTPPGAFEPYGAPNLFDFNTNVSVWLLPDVKSGESIWPPRQFGDDYRSVRGAHFASPTHGLSEPNVVALAPRGERRRERGMRLVKCKRATGWGVAK